MTSRGARDSAEPAVRPLHYELQLDILPATEAFNGTVIIDCELRGTQREIVLDATELVIEDAELDGLPVDHRREGEKVILSASGDLQPGKIRARIRFRCASPGNRSGVRFGPESFLTQFQPRDAHTLFPCFDDIRWDTTFAIRVATDPGMTVVCCGEEIERSVDNTRVHVEFEVRTPMPLHQLVMAGERDISFYEPIRIVSSGLPETHLEFIRSTTQSCLTYFGASLGVVYPCGRLDVVVSPLSDTPGMDYRGVIVLRKEDMVVDERSTRARRREAFRLIAHEVAHQWFGIVVAPASWSDLWISEGFATLLASRAMAGLRPDLHDSLEEVRASRRAMNADSFGSRPLGTATTERHDLFDPIIYEKSAAVLRMIESWIGGETFRERVSRFLGQRAGKRMTADDLWRSLSTSDFDVAQVGKHFVSRGGAPLVRIEWRGKQLFLSQDGQNPFPIPLSLTIFTVDRGVETRTMLLDTRERVLEVDTEISWAFANRGARGYFRTSSPPLPDDAVAHLDPSERCALISDRWDALWGGELDILQYLDGLQRKLYSPDQVGELRALLATGWRRDAWNASVRRVADVDDRETRGEAGDEAIIAVARDAINAWLNGGPVPAELERELLLASSSGDKTLFDSLERLIDRGDLPLSRRALLQALGSFRIESRRAAQLRLLSNPLLNGDEIATLLEALFANDAAAREAWNWVVSAWSNPEQRRKLQDSRGGLAAISAIADPALGLESLQWLTAQVSSDQRVMGIVAQIRRRLQSRTAFGLREQRAFDAHLVHQQAPGTTVRPSWLPYAILTAAYRSTELQQRWLERAGVPLPASSRSPVELSQTAEILERYQLQSIVHDVPFDATSQQQAQVMAEDLRDAAATSEVALGMLEGSADREAQLVTAAALLRMAAFQEMVSDAYVIATHLSGDHPSAARWRAQRTLARRDSYSVYELLAKVSTDSSDSLGFELWNRAVILPGLMRAISADVMRIAAPEQQNAAPEPWQIFGFDDVERQRWMKAGFAGPGEAAAWSKRRFDPEQARAFVERGLDAAKARAMNRLDRS